MQKTRYESIGEELYTETLPNGLTIQVLPKPGFNKSYAVFATNYGGADRRFRIGGKWIDTPAGVAHFLEHKMFDTPDGGNALAVLSANGANPNAFTSSGMTAYYFESTQGFEENLRTLLSFVSVPYFTEESVRKEQGIIGQEIRMIEDNPGFVVYNNAMRCLFRHNPVRDSVAGSIESIAEITADTLYDCHKIFYNPSNMTLAVVGDVDPEAVSRIAREVLPAEPGEMPERDYGEAEDELPAENFISVEMEVSAPQFIIASRFEPAPRGEARQRQRLIAELALRCLMGKTSAFYTELYAEGLLKQDFSAETDYSAGTASILAGGESAEPEQVLERLKQAADKLLHGGMAGGDFLRMRKSFYGAALRSLDSFEDVCVSLADCRFAGCILPEQYALIETITADEVRAFIAEALAPEKLALSVVCPRNARQG
ncbi:MAG: EF-P 5-aminopentanol modification-associated protein YfmH [Candidatus Heteroscillospira sp.]